MKNILKEIRLNPEWLGIPLVVIGWVLIKRFLILEDSTNATIPNDVLQMFVLGVFGLLLGNFVAHLGIKFNQPTIWKMYKSSVLHETTPPKEYYYSLALYLFAYVLTLIAVF
jgi:hypothetical protein